MIQKLKWGIGIIISSIAVWVSYKDKDFIGIIVSGVSGVFVIVGAILYSGENK